MADHPTAFTARQRILLLLAYLVAGPLVYLATLDNFFLCDDFGLIRAVQQGGPFGIWSRGPGGFFRPLVSLSLWIDLTLWGLNPLGFHLTNLLFHSLNAFLVCEVAGALLPDDEQRSRRPAAIFAGALFLVLMSHGEAVVWISGRVDVLATFFGLAAFRLVLAVESGRHHALIAAALLLFLLALGCKESAIPWPAIIAARTWWPGGDPKRSIGWRFGVPALFLGAFVAYLPLRRLMLGTLIGGYGSGVHLRIDPLLMLRNLVLFSGRTLVPPMHLEEILILFGLIAIGLFLLVRHRRRNPAGETQPPTPLWRDRLVPFLLLALALSLVPVLNLSLSERTHEGERFLYLPSLFSSLLLARLLPAFARKRSQLLLTMALLLLLSSGFLLRSTLRWRTASQIAAQIVDDLKQQDHRGRLVLLTLPDSLNGSYIFRNGVRSARALFDSRPGRVLLLSHFRLGSPEDTLQVRQNGLRFELRLDQKRNSFFNANVPGGGPLSSAKFETVVWTKRRIVLKLKRRLPGDLILYYSGGRLKALEPQRVK